MRPTSQKLLQQADLPALLVSDLTNIRYLTELQMTAGLFLVLPRRCILFVDSRYIEAARRAARGFAVEDAASLVNFMKKIRRCAIESDSVTIARMTIWKKKFKNTKFVLSSGAVEYFRRRKNDRELKLLRRARRLTQELLRRVPSALRRSITEEALARQLNIWALELGAEGLSFDPIVSFGMHTASPHHRPMLRKLRRGDIVQIDVGVKYNGYCADMSEVFFTAKPTIFQQRVYSTLCEAKDAATRAVKSGVTNHALDTIARDILAREGIEKMFTHSLGHGVGLDIHEGVSISRKAPLEKLLKNEVITIEPGVYFPGRFGMRVEDMVIV